MPRINWYQFGFVRIGSEYGIETIERSLAPLSKAVAQCARVIEEAKASGDDYYFDCVVDDETALIENLLGTAFVLCQSYITFIVSRVKALHKSCEENSIHLEATDNTKAGIMRLGSQLLSGTQYSQIQIIDAFANCFKHQEEWNGLWERLAGQAGQTASIVLAVGASQFSTGNFRTASEKLGNQSYENMWVFSNILQEWGRVVYEQYDSELHANGLL